MNEDQPNNPLHGVTLKAIVEDLVARRGWQDLGQAVRIRCFTHDPSINSSLKFLRKTEWARVEVEQLFVADQQKIERNRKRNQRRAGMRENRVEPGAEADSEPKDEQD